MPLYNLRNKKTGEEKECLLSISDKEKLIEEGEWIQIHKSTPGIVTHAGSIIGKTSGDWRDLLKRIKKGSGMGDTIHT